MSGRGLIESADEVNLTHPYPDIVLPALKVPLMNLTEQVAEKICGWCAHGLLKHYVDVAWAFGTLMRQINVDRFAPLVDAKLTKGRELFPEGYRTLTGITALLGRMAGGGRSRSRSCARTMGLRSRARPRRRASRRVGVRFCGGASGR